MANHILTWRGGLATVAADDPKKGDGWRRWTSGANMTPDRMPNLVHDYPVSYGGSLLDEYGHPLRFSSRATRFIGIRRSWLEQGQHAVFTYLNGTAAALDLNGVRETLAASGRWRPEGMFLVSRAGNLAPVQPVPTGVGFRFVSRNGQQLAEVIL